MKRDKLIKVTLEIPEDLYSQIKTVSDYLIKENSRITPERMLSDLLTMALMGSYDSAKKFIAERKKEEIANALHSCSKIKKQPDDAELENLSKKN